MPDAPLTPQDWGEPADDGGDAPHLIRGSDPVAPWGDRRPGVRFADGLLRLHGWRRVTARLVAVAILLGGVFLILAELFRT